eukprot:TRINITY_DN21151_c0_g1_i1.p4 TRINITY_DN21151_c0_g1~~TRINITY_DN21151_c0_g1_i1.p4  ORF type:complete len:104 (+),score=24.44 TRINITY_DN21151_c0_g1_i1:150-461(+)
MAPKKQGRPPKADKTDAKAPAKKRGRTAKKDPPAKKAKPAKSTEGGITQPRGRPPLGKNWDGVKGEWVDDGSGTAKIIKIKSSKPRGRPPAGKEWDEKKKKYV